MQLKWNFIFVGSMMNKSIYEQPLREVLYFKPDHQDQNHTNQCQNGLRFNLRLLVSISKLTNAHHHHLTMFDSEILQKLKIEDIIITANVYKHT